MSAGLRLWQVVLLLGLVVLAWRITALGVAGVQIGRLGDNLGRGGEEGTAAARQALDWYPGQAAALAWLGFATIPQDRAAAERLLMDAWRSNPTDPRPLMELARLAQARGDTGRADRLSERVDGLRPVDPAVQWPLGSYWLSRGDPVRALRHWSRSLEANPGARAAGFATLRALLQTPTAHAAFRPLLAHPPNCGRTSLRIRRRVRPIWNWCGSCFSGAASRPWRP